MLRTCNNVMRMSKMIQIRNVPDEVHRELKMRAAGAGRTLSDYLLEEISQAASKPTLAELTARLAEREEVELEPDAATLIRSARDGR